MQIDVQVIGLIIGASGTVIGGLFAANVYFVKVIAGSFKENIDGLIKALDETRKALTDLSETVAVLECKVETLNDLAGGFNHDSSN